MTLRIPVRHGRGARALVAAIRAEVDVPAIDGGLHPRRTTTASDLRRRISARRGGDAAVGHVAALAAGG